ncbi:MAG: CoA pyrophosphatase [Actinomycetales bacterium]|nr:CoA pyrophosphatase [Actinomycetales bacterium]
MTPYDTLPEWLRPVADTARTVRPEQLSRFLPPEAGGRESAVLVLFGEGPDGPDLLLIQRAATVSSHPGQPAFPGGAVDDTDADVVAAALREAEEETGLDPSGVHVFATLPALWLPPSGFVVTPVLGWWRAPSPIGVVDPGEVESVVRVPVAELLDPANRVSVSHPSGFVGPAFEVRGLLVWGFTAGLLSRLFALCGWERPWDASVLRPVPDVR